MKIVIQNATRRADVREQSFVRVSVRLSGHMNNFAVSNIVDLFPYSSYGVLL